MRKFSRTAAASVLLDLVLFFSWMQLTCVCVCVRACVFVAVIGVTIELKNEHKKDFIRITYERKSIFTSTKQ